MNHIVYYLFSCDKSSHMFNIISSNTIKSIIKSKIVVEFQNGSKRKKYDNHIIWDIGFSSSLYMISKLETYLIFIEGYLK